MPGVRVKPPPAPLQWHAFATHNWGSDDAGRNNHERVLQICRALERQHDARM